MEHHSFNSSPFPFPPSPQPIKKFLDPPLNLMLDIGCGNGKDGFCFIVWQPLYSTGNCLLTAHSLIWHQAQANGFKNFFEIILFCREAKYWLQACSMEPTKIMSSCISWHLPLQKILKSVFLIAELSRAKRASVAPWVKK